MGRNVKTISHLFYADDMFLFTNSQLRSVGCLKTLLRLYEESSGQQINFSKSGFYPSKLIQRRRLHKLEQRIGCTSRKLPLKYLGAPLFKGRCRADYLEDLFTKFSNRLEDWKEKFLSFAGKMTSIRSVLGSLPVNTLARLVIPKQFSGRIRRPCGLPRESFTQYMGRAVYPKASLTGPHHTAQEREMVGMVASVTWCC